MTSRLLPDKFLMAFSFAGEQWDLVRAVAEAVAKELDRDTVFLDEWFEYYIAGADADLKLLDSYSERRALAVACVSAQYGTKPWTQAEHETVRARQMKARASSDPLERDPILPIRVGEGDVKGIPFNLETSVGRARVCGLQAGWQGARRTQDRPLLRRATPPAGLQVAQSGA